MEVFDKVSRDGYKYRIISNSGLDIRGVKSYSYCNIEYEDGEIINIAKPSAQKSKHNRYNLLRGIGIYDLPERKDSSCVIYQCWSRMLLRVTMSGNNFKCNRSQSTIDSYEGCKVCDEWLYFSNFKEWVLTQDYLGWDLDKDLLGDGKLYSPDTCCFIPHKVNCLMVVQSKGSSGLVGMAVLKINSVGKYQVNPYMDNKPCKGLYKSFSDKYEAHKYWQKVKSDLLVKASTLEYDGRELSDKIKQGLIAKSNKILSEMEAGLVTTKI